MTKIEDCGPSLVYRRLQGRANKRYYRGGVRSELRERGGHKLDGFDENYGFDKFVRSARSDWGFMTLSSCQLDNDEIVNQ